MINSHDGEFFNYEICGPKNLIFSHYIIIITYNYIGSTDVQCPTHVNFFI